jgi:hypothetical protein
VAETHATVLTITIWYWEVGPIHRCTFHVMCTGMWFSGSANTTGEAEPIESIGQAINEEASRRNLKLTPCSRVTVRVSANDRAFRTQKVRMW